MRERAGRGEEIVRSVHERAGRWEKIAESVRERAGDGRKNETRVHDRSEGAQKIGERNCGGSEAAGNSETAVATGRRRWENRESRSRLVRGGEVIGEPVRDRAFAPAL